MWSNGETIRDSLHIDKVMFGLLAKVRAHPVKTSCKSNLGSGHGLPIDTLISKLSLLAGRMTEVIYDSASKFDIPFSVLRISSA